ncbi:CAP domain-containing protein [Sphingomonas silueang]|uniref:CAP domain-containing protein n=1 Tax=Sphingomonas silueang TaxID=3156617 RepID=UPI0032B3D012
MTLFQRAMLQGHNAARAEAGLPPLAWDPGLALQAKRYANVLAATGQFEHSAQPRGEPDEGENLWTGTRGAYLYEEMIKHWVDEKHDYVPRAIPDVSRTGDFGDVGHYTQIMWHSTRRMGCAESSNREDDYLVCRYVPAGNVEGERAF